MNMWDMGVPLPNGTRNHILELCGHMRYSLLIPSVLHADSCRALVFHNSQTNRTLDRLLFNNSLS